MRIILDTAILVRGHGSSKGLARDLLISTVESDHILLLSNEMLYALRVGQSSALSANVGTPRPFRKTHLRLRRFPARGRRNCGPESLVADTDSRRKRHCRHQTAVIGEADILCTKDRDFFEPPAEGFLRKAGIAVLDDISLMRQLRS